MSGFDRVQRLVNENPDMIIPNFLKCPSCRAVFGRNNFQCHDGHVVCAICYDNIRGADAKCPVCKISYPNDEAIQNCVIGQFSEAYFAEFVECTYHKNGCSAVLRRLEMIPHLQTCHFNFEKYGKMIYFCHHFGFRGCDYKVNNGNGSAYLEHLREFHKFFYTESPTIIHQLGDLTQEEMLIKEKKYFNKTILDFPDNFIVTFSAKIERRLANISVWFPKCSSEPRSAVNISYQFLKDGLQTGNNSILKNCSEPVFFREFNTFVCTVGEGEFSVQYDIDGAKKLAGAEGKTLQLKLQVEGLTGPAQPLEMQVPTFQCTSSLPKLCWNREYKNSAVKSNILQDFVLAMKKSWTSDIKVFIQRLYKKTQLLNDRDPMMPMWIDHALLFTAAEHGTPEALEIVLDLIKTNVNVIDKSGATPLFLTMLTKDAGKALLKAQLLIGRGADTKLVTHLGTSILQYAIAANNFPAVKEFIKQGADVNHKRSDGKTPLGSCFKVMPIHNNLDTTFSIADALLENGAKRVTWTSVTKNDTVLQFVEGTGGLKKLMEKFMVSDNAAGQNEDGTGCN